MVIPPAELLADLARIDRLCATSSTLDPESTEATEEAWRSLMGDLSNECGLPDGIVAPSDEVWEQLLQSRSSDDRAMLRHRVAQVVRCVELMRDGHAWAKLQMTAPTEEVLFLVRGAYSLRVFWLFSLAELTLALPLRLDVSNEGWST